MVNTDVYQIIVLTVLFDHVVGVAFLVEDVDDGFFVEVVDCLLVDDDQVTVDRLEETDEVLLFVYVEDDISLVEEGVDVTCDLDQVDAVVVTREDDAGCTVDRDEVDDDFVVGILTVDDDTTGADNLVEADVVFVPEDDCEWAGDQTEVELDLWFDEIELVLTVGADDDESDEVRDQMELLFTGEDDAECVEARDETDENLVFGDLTADDEDLVVGDLAADDVDTV